MTGGEQLGLRFDGGTYDHERDSVRLSKQWWDIWLIVKDGRWHTLAELSRATLHPEASVSARLRDLRKERFGRHEVERRYVSHGLWEYRVTPSTQMVIGPEQAT